MKLESNIGWCDATIGGAVIGCTKISPGCANCYAANDTPARVLRAGGVETWGPSGVRHPVAGFAAKVRGLNKLCICNECHEALQINCLTTNHACESYPAGMLDGTPRRIRLFADSNSDWLDGQWPVETLAAFLKVIHDAPNVDFLLLTKRPESFFQRLEAVWKHNIGQHQDFCDWLRFWGMDGKPLKNIWIGVSAENQKCADERIPDLLSIPAAVRFVSAEPLLSPIRLTLANIDWLIVGGESGKNRRACAVEWITDIADQCQAANVPVWVKQHNELKPGQQGAIPDRYWAMKQTPCAK